MFSIKRGSSSRSEHGLLLIGIALILLSCRFFERIASTEPVAAKTPAILSETPQIPENPITTAAEPAPVSTLSGSPVIPHPAASATVNLFLIALDDQGVSGRMVGCGDSLVPVAQLVEVLSDEQTEPAEENLRAAVQALLDLKTQYYGQSGLYNALYQSDLQVDEVQIEQGTAQIHLSGTMQLGGVCDNPRVEEQLKATARQFPEVLEPQIWINGIALEELLSQK